MAAENVYRRVIPTGTIRALIGVVCLILGLLCELAATPFNGAGVAGAALFAVGGSLLFWGIILGYLAALEEKLLFLIGPPPEAAAPRESSGPPPPVERLSEPIRMRGEP